MSDVMVDTSVWVDYFRGGKGAVCDMIDTLLDQDRAVLCGVVEMELLHGVRPHERKTLDEVLSALPYVALDRADFVTAGERLGELRRKGILIPATDCLIGVLCRRHDLELLTTDRHFDHLTDVHRVRT